MKVIAIFIALLTLFASDKLNQKIEIGYFGTTGNTNIKSLTAGYKFNYAYSKEIQINLFSDIYYSTRDGETSAQRYRTKLDTYYKKRNFYYYLQLAFLRNTFEGYNQQYNINPGVGITAYENKKNKLDILFGYLYRIDNYTNKESKTFNYAKGDIKYIYKLAKKNSLNTEIDYIYNIENSNDFETSLLSELKLWVIDSVYFKFSFELKYDNLPPYQKERVDTTTKISIVYDF
jgi:putative salt-induced outer membrane protein